MPRTLTPMLAGSLLALAVGGGAFGLQVAALRQPRRAELIGTDSLGRLIAASRVDGVERVGRRVASSTCVEGRDDEASGLALGDGAQIVAVGRRVTVVDRGRLPAPPRDALALAGCPPVLERSLGNRLTRHLLRVRAVRVDGQRAYDLVLGDRPRIDLFVGRRSFLPVAVHVHGRWLNAWSDVEVRRLTARGRALLRSEALLDARKA